MVLLTLTLCNFMLDTGAAVLLLGTDTWNMITGISTLASWTNPGLVGVGGTPLRVSGIARLQLWLSRTMAQLDFT